MQDEPPPDGSTPLVQHCHRGTCRMSHLPMGAHSLSNIATGCGGKVKKHLVKTTLIKPDQDSNATLPVISSLVYCESNALDRAATEAGGGSGFIGTALTNLLRTNGYGVTIVSRMPGPQRISWSDLAKFGLPQNVTAVVNLAGQNVLDVTKRWTPGFKQNVWASRINTTSSLAQAINKAENKPMVFVTISGVESVAILECVGIYKPSPDIEYTEDSLVQEFDFLSKLCHEWEGAARLPQNLGVRQVVIRSGVVLGKNGGMVKQLYIPFYLGLGGPVGSGKQYMPWIHIDDLTNLLLFAIQKKDVKGVLNGVAPEIVTNKEFSQAFGRALWRPALIPLPEFVVNTAFSEERAKIMTEGQRVVPKRTLSYGFHYMYPDIETACKNIVNQ
uniref:Epimerase family protein SDR39U1 n=1 Tax=Timema monikensis TaxID=170555 RepID=A0A7R9EIC1_9NEOP|nr:unnamed protein product [Timema monikensis]